MWATSFGLKPYNEVFSKQSSSKIELIKINKKLLDLIINVFVLKFYLKNELQVFFKKNFYLEKETFLFERKLFVDQIFVNHKF